MLDGAAMKRFTLHAPNSRPAFFTLGDEMFIDVLSNFGEPLVVTINDLEKFLKAAPKDGLVIGRRLKPGEQKQVIADLAGAQADLYARLIPRDPGALGGVVWRGVDVVGFQGAADSSSAPFAVTIITRRRDMSHSTGILSACLSSRRGCRPALMDAMGFKGIWKTHSLDDIVSKFQVMKEHAERMKEMTQVYEMAGIGVEVQIEFLSDTVVASCFDPVSPGRAVMVASLYRWTPPRRGRGRYRSRPQVPSAARLPWGDHVWRISRRSINCS